jgi:hypothetical protein
LLGFFGHGGGLEFEIMKQGGILQEK